MINKIAFLLLAIISLNSNAAEQKPYEIAIASAHPLATAAGFEVIAKGGNAFDAAVAVAAALAVVEPYNSGFGGGGYWLLQQPGKEAVMIDARETAPDNATADKYIDDTGELIPDASLKGPKAAAIPGEPKAMAYITEEYGKLPLSVNLAPAIRLAEEGFEIGEDYIDRAKLGLASLRQHKIASAQFLVDNSIPQVGYLLKQPNLAQTLKIIAEKGVSAFYAGEIAKRLVEAVQQDGGYWQLADLENYDIKVRPALTTNYKGYEVTTANLSSSGGAGLITMLNILENYDLNKYNEVEKNHLIIESMRRAYCERSNYYGDSDFVDVPIDALISKDNAKKYVAGISMEQATKSEDLNCDNNYAKTHTTHYSIIDNQGNAISSTLSLNLHFGSGYVAGDTGILLNDELDDFNFKANEANAFGFKSSGENIIASGKRPLSSMTPTIVTNNCQSIVLGAPGGGRIPNMVLLAILDIAEGKHPNDWLQKKRFHQQYLPDRVQHEPGTFSKEMTQALETKGHIFDALGRTFGNMQVAIKDQCAEELMAFADPRGEGEGRVERFNKL